MKSLTIVILAVFLSACGSFPKNAKLDQFDANAGYRFDKLEAGPKNTDSLFVVVVMSGGGTRAAALSYGVLNALRETTITWQGEQKTLLDEVDIISSVSGGSFTAAYFALHRDAIFDGAFEHEFLKHDVQKDLFYRLFVPGNWFKLAGRSYGRSDLAAEYYNTHLFNGATYQDLIDNKQRPFLIVNATDMTLGAQFPFIQDQFDLLCSDLAHLPLARSVASSSAFPGLLTPLTYENYAGKCDFKDYPWVELAQLDRRENADRTIRADQRKSYYQPLPPGARDHVHLVDGGVSDNIGLRGPLYAISSTDPTYSILRKINREEVDKLVVIVVNAATDPKTKLDQSPNVPGVTDVLTAAATIPLDNYSADTVSLIKAKISEFNAGYDMLRDCDGVLQSRCPGTSLNTGQLYAVDLYMVEVAFDFIQDVQQRERFKNIGTNFSLPDETIDELKEIGCVLYRDDPQLKMLLDGDGRSEHQIRGNRPDCHR